MSGRPRPAGPMARIVKAVDFERVLQVRSRASTPHFAVHHIVGAPALAKASASKLSTTSAPSSGRPVDDFASRDLVEPDSWVGVVVPKRHARRAVTRSLMKRQIYAAAERHREEMAPGLWIVRLRAPFDRTLFPSATSAPLRRGVREELEALLEAAKRGIGA